MENYLGKYCMVRTRDAGVFAGVMKELAGSQVILTDARRIWYWEGAATLSQLATDGTSEPDECKFPTPVPEVMLFDVIEIIPITDKARASIESVAVWSA